MSHGVKFEDIPTPRTDAVVSHGARHYNHPRYEKKLIELCKSLERELYVTQETLVKKVSG